MKTNDRTPDMRALALAVTFAGAVTASLLLAQVTMTASASFAGYGIDDYATASAVNGVQ